MDKDFDSLFTNGIEFRDNGYLTESSQVFLNIIRSYPNDSRLPGIYTVLGGIYNDLEDYNSSTLYFKKATELKPQSELASLGLYLSYIKLDKSSQAIEEMKRFLDVYPAKLYRDTIEELLGDLKEGYATSFEETIVLLAKKNGINI